jgi:sarcosine oxidase, subunit delta
MLLISCPWCGPRDETEFRCGGEAHIVRPKDPDALSDGEWADYLFMRTNPKGVHHERWVHTQGCRRWFNVLRHTVTHQILAIYRIGEPPPEVEHHHR